MRRPLNFGVSLWLDGCRIAAAFVVLFHHVFQPPYHDSTIHFPGRSAVIVFFVISGFVIAYATDAVRDWRVYAVARLARVYSVAVPALLLTAILVFLADRWWGHEDEFLKYDRPALRLLLSALFVNQFWNLTITALSNGPYWSLCYEVWYYVLFGVVWFCQGHVRWLIAALMMLMVGPRILLLMPIWALGVALYFAMKARLPAANTFNKLLFWGVFVAFLLVLLVHNPADIWSMRINQSLLAGYWHVGRWKIFVGGDGQFPSDFLLGVMFSATVWLSAAAFKDSAPQQWPGRAIRWCASYTFSLYLYHAPLLIFLHFALKGAVSADVRPWLLIGLILLAVWVLGSLTEHRKGPYTLLFRRLLTRRREQAL